MMPTDGFFCRKMLRLVIMSGRTSLSNSHGMIRVARSHVVVQLSSIVPAQGSAITWTALKLTNPIGVAGPPMKLSDAAASLINELIVSVLNNAFSCLTGDHLSS